MWPTKWFCFASYISDNIIWYVIAQTLWIKLVDRGSLNNHYIDQDMNGVVTFIFRIFENIFTQFWVQVIQL